MATKLKKMEFNSVDMVRSGANQEADICLFKSADQETSIFKKFINWLTGSDQAEEPEVVEKDYSTFNQITNGREKQEKLWQYTSAMTDSLCSIQDDHDLDAAGKERMMRQSLEQFTAAMGDLIGELCSAPVHNQEPVVAKHDDSRYDEIVEIEKFNPYHDARGRFASAGGATSFTYAPGKSKAHDNAIARAQSGGLKDLKKQYGIVDVGLTDTKDKQKFADSIAAAKKANPNGGAVDEHPIEELETYKTFLSENGMAGVAVKPDGDITAVFKNSDFKQRGVVNDLIITARAEGGTKMDCYGQFLVNSYEQCGFTPVARVAFNADYVSDPVLLKNKPDVYVMMKNTDTIQQVCQKNSAKAYKKSTQAELDNLPTFEYDEALKYRDDLLAKQEGGNK